MSLALPVSGQSAQKQALPQGASGSSASRDLGVDVAIVTAAGVNLREGPGTDQPVVAKLNKGTMLALVDRQKIGSWFNVIHVQSGKEGWIHSSLVKVSYTNQKRETALFQAEPSEVEEDPKVVIHNESGRTIYLKVGGERFEISPRSEQTAYLTPATHSFHASAPGVIPAFGKKEFEFGHVYTWRFYIRTGVGGGRVRVPRRR